MSNKSTTPTDEETLEQLRGIEDEGKALPLISGLMSPTDLLPAYENNPGFFVLGIHDLAKRFSSMRKVRGDGNCFYRALLYSYLEELLSKVLSSNEGEREEGRKEQKRFLTLIEGSKDQLIEVGYDEFVFEMFYDEFVELLGSLVAGGGGDESLTPASLLEHFRGAQADCYTWYMRLLTAGYLIKHHERFSPFVMLEDAASASSMADVKVNVLLNGAQGDAAMRGYCQREVEPMGKESEQLHVTALTEVLGLRVDIHYLDGRPFAEDAGVSAIQFHPPTVVATTTQEETRDIAAKDACPFALHLLYRPGHYDILYKDRLP